MFVGPLSERCEVGIFRRRRKEEVSWLQYRWRDKSNVRVKDTAERICCIWWESVWAVGEVFTFPLCWLWNTRSHAEGGRPEPVSGQSFRFLHERCCGLGKSEKCDGEGICLCSVVVIYEEKAVSVCGSVYVWVLCTIEPWDLSKRNN